MNTSALASHVEQLCIDHDITLKVIPDCFIESFSEIRLIHVQPIIDMRTYLCAMHEIGHSVLCHRPEQDRAWKEILAWKWVAANSPIPWTKDMEHFRDWCLSCWGIPSDFDPVIPINSLGTFR